MTTNSSPPLPKWARDEIPVRCVALGQSPDGTWHSVIQLITVDGNLTEKILPRADVRKSGLLMDTLSNAGLSVPHDKAAIAELFAKLNEEPTERLALLDKPGWCGSGFCLPSRDVAKDTQWFRLTPCAAAAHIVAMSNAGTLDGWKDCLGLLAQSSHAVFATCAALGAPLLRPLGIETCGIHAFGRSGRGKSHAYGFVPNSIYGHPAQMGIDWNGTSIGIEEHGAAHNDLVLTIDDTSKLKGTEQEKAKIVAEVSYGLTGGKPRKRSSATGMKATPIDWTCVVLSSGEKSLMAIEAEGQQERMAGAQARLTDIPVNSNGGKGIYETIPDGFENLDAVLKAVREGLWANHGHAGKEFIDKLVLALSQDREGFINELNTRLVRWYSKAGLKETDLPTRRQARIFALAYVAGCLASKWNIVPWEPAVIGRATIACYRVSLRKPSTESHPTDPLTKLKRRLVARKGFQDIRRIEQPKLNDAASAYIGALRGRSVFFVPRETLQNWVGPGISLKAVLKSAEQKGWLIRQGSEGNTLQPGGVFGNRRFLAFLVRPFRGSKAA